MARSYRTQVSRILRSLTLQAGADSGFHLTPDEETGPPKYGIDVTDEKASLTSRTEGAVL